MDKGSPGSSVHEDIAGKNTGMGRLFLLQGIFLTQESNLGSPAMQVDSLKAELHWEPWTPVLSLKFALLCSFNLFIFDFPGGSVVKNLPAMQVRSGRSPGKGNGNQLSILAWEIPWREEPGRLQYMGLQKSQT